MSCKPKPGRPTTKASRKRRWTSENKSFNADRFEKRVRFAEGTGMREVYLWGAEYWYYRKVKLHDPSLWNVAKEEFARAN
jgi:hypothetical protein